MIHHIIPTPPHPPKPTTNYHCPSPQVYPGAGVFEGGSIAELTGGVEDGALELQDVEVFDASQRFPAILERPWREVLFNNRLDDSLILIGGLLDYSLILIGSF